jgi:ribonuclease HI
MKERSKGYGPRQGDEWSSIWKILAPHKAKHLLWRICKECLPTRTRLRNRHVQCPIECPLCLSHIEEEKHLFFDCVATKEAWHAMGLSHVIQSRLDCFDNVRNLIFDMCRNENKDVAGKTATLLWFIWQNHNNLVWNDNKTSTQQIGVQTAQFWHQWVMVNGRLNEQHQHVQQQTTVNIDEQWQPPSIGYLKCNVDASFYNMAGATGWCLRDHNGQFKLAGTNRVKSPLNIFEGEAMAIIEAIEMMMQRDFSYVTFESDSKTVVDAINSSHVGLSEFSILISHIKSLLSSNNYFEIKYVKRQANMAAHSLARAAYYIYSRRIFYSIPRCIDSYLINEMR